MAGFAPDRFNPRLWLRDWLTRPSAAEAQASEQKLRSVAENVRRPLTISAVDLVREMAWIFEDEAAGRFVLPPGKTHCECARDRIESRHRKAAHSTPESSSPQPMPERDANDPGTNLGGGAI